MGRPGLGQWHRERGGMQSRVGVGRWRHPLLHDWFITYAPPTAALRAREIVCASLSMVCRPEHVALEVGAGTGWYTPFLASQVRRVVAIEPSPAMRRRLRARLRREAAENVEVGVGWLPDSLGANGSFDGVLAIGVLDYLPDLREALCSLSVTVGPGGWLVLSAPLANRRSWMRTTVGRLWGPRVHVWALEEILEAAEDAGLRSATVVSAAGRTLVLRAVSAGGGDG